MTKLNGNDVPSIVVGNSTYVAISGFIRAGATVSTLPNGKYVINGHTAIPAKVGGVVYVPWNAIPGTIDVNVNGEWHFTLPKVAEYAPPVTDKQVVAVIHGRVENDAFFFALPGVCENIQLDTGAFELTLNEDIAKAIGLQPLGNIEVGGIGGTQTAWTSQVSFKLGDLELTNVPCVCVPNFTSSDGLFGFDALVRYGLTITVDPVAQTLTFLK